MKMSTKGRYGLRAMLDLAVNSGGGHVAIKDIAERQNLSCSYLEQVFSALRKAGLVKSVKGAQGGYILGSSPAKLTVGAILRVLEGDLSIVDEREEDGESLGRTDYCLKTSIWDKINENIAKVVDSITLEDLLEEYRTVNGSSSDMYYI